MSTVNSVMRFFFKRFINKSDENPNGTPINLRRPAEFTSVDGNGEVTYLAEVCNFTFPTSLKVDEAIKRAEALLQSKQDEGLISGYYLRLTKDGEKFEEYDSAKEGTVKRQLTYTVNAMSNQC